MTNPTTEQWEWFIKGLMAAKDGDIDSQIGAASAWHRIARDSEKFKRAFSTTKDDNDPTR